MIGCLIEWGQPADDDVGNVVGFIRQIQQELDGIRLHKDSVQTEYQNADHPRHLTELQIAHQHQQHHDRGVAQHQGEDGNHALIGPAHFQSLYQCRNCHTLTGIGVAQDRRCGAPHIGDERLLDGKDHRADQHKCQIDGGGCQDVDDLPGDPCPSVRPNEVKWRTG